MDRRKEFWLMVFSRVLKGHGNPEFAVDAATMATDHFEGTLNVVDGHNTGGQASRMESLPSNPHDLLGEVRERLNALEISHILPKE